MAALNALRAMGRAPAAVTALFVELELGRGVDRRHDPAVADAFVTARVAADAGFVYGTLPAGIDTGRILERAAVGDCGRGRRLPVIRRSRGAAKP